MKYLVEFNGQTYYTLSDIILDEKALKILREGDTKILVKYCKDNNAGKATGRENLMVSINCVQKIREAPIDMQETKEPVTGMLYG